MLSNNRPTRGLFEGVSNPVATRPPDPGFDCSVPALRAPFTQMGVSTDLLLDKEGAAERELVWCAWSFRITPFCAADAARAAPSVTTWWTRTAW